MMGFSHRLADATPTARRMFFAAAAAIALCAPLRGGMAERETTLAASLCSASWRMFASGLDANSTGEARPATVLKRLTCDPLPDAPGKSMTTAIVEFPPGAYSGPHRHPGSTTAFVIRGTVRSQLEGAPAQTYQAGQAWFEPKGILHVFAENASAREPAAILATFVTDEGCGPLVIREPQPAPSGS